MCTEKAKGNTCCFEQNNVVLSMKLKKLKGFAIGEDNNSFMRLTIGFNSNTNCRSHYCIINIMF